MKRKSTVPQKQSGKAANPFEDLAEHAIDESRKGKTVSLDDYGKKRKIAEKRK